MSYHLPDIIFSKYYTYTAQTFRRKPNEAIVTITDIISYSPYVQALIEGPLWQSKRLIQCWSVLERGQLCQGLQLNCRLCKRHDKVDLQMIRRLPNWNHSTPDSLGRHTLSLYRYELQLDSLKIVSCLAWHAHKLRGEVRNACLCSD